MKPEQLRSLLIRFGLSLVFSIALILGISEGYYLLTRDSTSRAPEIIELVIPAGTSESIALGQSVLGIPKSLVFVMGDTLIVKNQDSVAHELGPLWIPAESSASLVMEKASDQTIRCSFQTTNYMGMTVKEAVTWKSRLGALWYGGPPMLMFMLVYSYLFFPMKEEKTAAPDSDLLTPDGVRSHKG